MDRPWIEAGLKFSSISESDLPALLVQRVARLRGRKGLCTRFIKYLIASRAFTDYFLGIQTGTAVPHISGNQIKQFPFALPSTDEQQAIAHVLGTLDDKIELNRRMNQTLEEIARTIFTSWFVRFDPVRAKADGRQPEGMDADTAALFPDSFVDSDLGPIPAGWEVRPLDQIATFLNGLALQRFPMVGGDWLPAIKIAQMRQGNTNGADKVGANVPAAYIVDDGDILFSWSGSLEVEAWCGGRGALNQHLFKVTSNEFPKWFYYEWLRYHLDDFRAIAASKVTTMGHIQRRHLSDAMVLIPPAAMLEQIGRLMQPLLKKRISGQLESRTLAEIRDALLPKLLSGELRVHEAEAMAGRAL